MWFVVISDWSCGYLYMSVSFEKIGIEGVLESCLNLRPYKTTA